MKWFKHQSDARNSLKLRKVRRKYGADGYAIYWFCLEAIAYDVDKDNLTFELKEDAETIGFELSIQESRVMEIMQYMVSIGLFESSHNVITCLKLADSIDKSMTASSKMRAWLGAKSVHDGKQDGYVYFMLATRGASKKIKIGKSANPSARLTQLQNRSDCIDWDMSIISTVKSNDTLNLERGLHEKYKNQSLGREFFSITDELIAEAISYKSDANLLQLDASSVQAELEVEVEVEVEKNKNTMSDSTNTDAIEILNYLNEVTGQKLKPTTDSHLKPIRARLREGSTVEDCKKVIDFKHKQWKGTLSVQYLRPGTLFIPKNFGGYLLGANTAKPQHNVNDIGRDFSAPANWSN